MIVLWNAQYFRILQFLKTRISEIIAHNVCKSGTSDSSLSGISSKSEFPFCGQISIYCRRWCQSGKGQPPLVQPSALQPPWTIIFATNSLIFRIWFCQHLVQSQIPKCQSEKKTWTEAKCWRWNWSSGQLCQPSKNLVIVVVTIFHQTHLHFILIARRCKGLN